MAVHRNFMVGAGCFVLLVGAIGLGAYVLQSMASRSDLLKLGSPAPDFTARTSDGIDVHLASLRGNSRAVLIFYPGDNTPGCTAQLCSFRDSWAALRTAATVVFGVNPASASEHKGFASKFSLPFPLIVDANEDIASRYGCRALFGILKRTVYIIDRHGNVAWVQRGNPPPSDILAVLRTLHDD